MALFHGVINSKALMKDTTLSMIVPSDDRKNIGFQGQRQVVKDFFIKFTKNLKKGARSTVWLLTPRLTAYIFPSSRSLQRYA